MVCTFRWSGRNNSPPSYRTFCIVTRKHSRCTRCVLRRRFVCTSISCRRAWTYTLRSCLSARSARKGVWPQIEKQIRKPTPKRKHETLMHKFASTRDSKTQTKTHKQRSPKTIEGPGPSLGVWVGTKNKHGTEPSLLLLGLFSPQTCPPARQSLANRSQIWCACGRWI